MLPREEKKPRLESATHASLEGVPDDFMSHSARHAGIALRKEGASVLISTGYQTKPWCDAEVMSLARMSARTYVTHYLRNIRAAALDECPDG